MHGDYIIPTNELNPVKYKRLRLAELMNLAFKYNIIPEVHEKIEKINNSDLIVSLNLSDFDNIDKDSYNLVDMSSIRF